MDKIQTPKEKKPEMNKTHRKKKPKLKEKK